MNHHLKAFVLGHPIEHSLSPVLHSAAYQALGLDASYNRLDTEVEQFSSRMEMGEDDANLLGFSVTMPLKKEACAAVQHVSDLGKALGVVNTVYWRESSVGRRESFGHNTDVSGIVNALIYAGLQKSVEGRFAVIGGGGTAISAVVAGQVLGYRSVDVFVRSAHRAQDVAEVAAQLGMECQLIPLENVVADVEYYEAVISTLPAGAADHWCAQLHQIASGAVLLDVSYDPWPSKLAQRWVELGGVVVSGLEMLMYQAFEQVKLFTGHEVSDRFDNELEVLNSMCRSIGLPDRSNPPEPVAGLS